MYFLEIVPFLLDKDRVRSGETHVHEALREALVNTLIHADHQSSRPLTVIKRPDSFLFANPGRLRIPLSRLYEGGVSDPRNPHLQRMFQMLGLGEKAGSGFQKILRAWKEQTWIMPLVTEKLDLEMTSVALPMISMIPENVEKELRGIVGNEYGRLTEIERIVLVLAHRFGAITNADIQHYRDEHPREIGECLKKLTQKGWLQNSGHGRGTRYQLGGGAEDDLFSGSSEHYESSPQHYESSPQHYESSPQHYERMLEIAAPVRERGRASKEVVENTILAICAEDFVNLRTLAQLLGRTPESIRNHYLASLLKRRLLVPRFPGHPSHPQQGYRTVESGK